MSDRETNDNRPDERITLIDTHAHLTFAQFDEDRSEVMQRAHDCHVLQIVTVGSGEGVAGNGKAVEFAASKENIFATVGIHPHDAKIFDDAALGEIERFAAHERVVAIGETGLDFHYRHSEPDDQMKCFRAQLGLAHRCGKPVVIHSREAHDDVWRILMEEGVPPRGGVFHCFSGNLAFAEKVVGAGLFISFSGIVTYPSAHDLQGVAAAIPLEDILIETDCPYLAPQAVRGRRNEPAFVEHVAHELARAKDISVYEVARITTLNARRLFGLPGAETESRIAYRMRNALYLNITNRCNLTCTFCLKAGGCELGDINLKLEREPDIEQIFQAMGHPEEYDEVVFCGFGEPTKRIELLKEVARRMKTAGVKRVRLNTDGLANLIYGRNVAAELSGLIDAVSVSLNASDAATYARLCPSAFGEEAYAAVKAFLIEAKKHVPEVVASAVALPGLDIEACRRVAEDELGVAFRRREYIDVPRENKKGVREERLF